MLAKKYLDLKAVTQQWSWNYYPAMLLQDAYKKVSWLKSWSAVLATFLKKRLRHRCFPVNYVKFLRTLISKNICERLLLLRQQLNYLNSPCMSYSRRQDMFKRVIFSYRFFSCSHKSLQFLWKLVKPGQR